MSKGFGATQNAIMGYVKDSWMDDGFVLVSDLYSELTERYHKASIARALKNLVDNGFLYRHGETLYLPDDIRHLEREQIIERDEANGLPWWCRKQFQNP